MANAETMLQRLKQYACGICGSQPDQISHHKSHLETDKHKTKKELFKLQLEKMQNTELHAKYNTDDLLVILEAIETITTDFILEDTLDTKDEKDNKKLKSKSKKTKTQLEDTQLENQDNPEHIARMEHEAQQANEHLMEISNRDALRDKIHEIHNYLRNNGAGYGMTALKVFNIFYGLKKFEMCNNEYIKKLQPGDSDLYAKYKLNDKCRFSKIMEKIKYINDYKFNDPQYPKSPEQLDEEFTDYILKDVLDGINTSMLNQYLMYEIPDDLQPKIYKHIITEIDSIFDVEQKCNVLLSGKIYEYFIGRDETAISELGAYFTDRHIVNYIYDEKLQPKLDENGGIVEMIDMFGGSGGFTTGYIDYLNKNHLGGIDWSKELKKVSHYDMNKDVVKSAWLEMFCLTGELPHHDNVKSTNSFMSEFGNKKYKLIVTNPPYGGDKVAETDTQIKHAKIKEYIKKILPTIENAAEKAKLSIQLKEIEKDEKLDKQKLENNKVGLNIKGQGQRSSRRINKYAEEHNISTANDKESISLIMLMDMVDIGGTACGVLKEGVFFNKTYKDIRKCLIENYNVREVISVPSDQFENTSTKTSILIFDNLADKKTSSVKFSEMIVERFEEDKFVMQNGYVYLVENKGDISKVIDREVSSATREELLKNPICSLNGKDYSKNTMEAGEGFKLVKMGDIASVFCGKNLPKDRAIKGIYKVYGGGNSAYTHNEYNVEGFNILLSRVGNNNINLVNEKFYLTDNGFILNISNEITKKYVGYYLTINSSEILKLSNGTAQKVINKSKLNTLQLPIPTTDQSIKQWVDKISKPFDELNSKKKRISVLEEEVQTRIKEITENEDCDEVELGSICKIYSGKPIKKENRIGTLYPYCSANGIDGYVNEYLFDGNYILCAQDGSIGATHLMKGKIYPSNHVWLLDIKDTSINYIYRILKHFTNYDNYKTGSVIPKITKDKLEKIKISIPKDKSLITVLESKFQEIEKLQDEVKQAEALYKQYLDELATAAIKKQSTLDTIPIPDTTSTEPTTTTDTKPKKTKVSITKKKSSKAQQIVDTSLDGILGASSS